MTDPDHAPLPERRNFYGRIRGKTMRASQKTYIAEDLADLTLHGLTREENPARSPIPAPFAPKPLWLEVGFGGGEHLVHMAARYPEIGLIGCEPFVNGIAMLLGKMRQANLSNLLLHPGDVRDLLEVLPQLSYRATRPWVEGLMPLEELTPGAWQRARAKAEETLA